MEELINVISNYSTGSELDYYLVKNNNEEIAALLK